MFEFSVSKDIEQKNDIIREVTIREVEAHFMSSTYYQGIEN